MKRKLNLLKALCLFVLMLPILVVVGLTGLKEVTEKLAAKGKLISQIYEEAGEDLDFTKVKSLEGSDTTQKVEALKALGLEVTELTDQRVTLIDAEKTLKFGRELNIQMNEPAPGAIVHPEGLVAVHKTLGELAMEAKFHTELKGKDVTLDIDMKTEMTAAAGWDPPTVREARVELYPIAPINVIDVIPMLTTGRDTIKYMKVTTWDNNAAEAAESGAFGEAALALTEQSDEVEKIAVFLPVTDEQLEDVAGLAGFINTQLTLMIRGKLDGQILQGDGSTPSLLGTVNISGIQTQTKGNDPVPDAIYKSFTAIRVTAFAEPSVLFIHPNDWQGVRLLTTADGIYIFGSPMEAGPQRIWGVPVVQTTRAAEGTGVTGDYARYSNLYMRSGVVLKVTDSHGSLFVEGVQVIRATLRVAMVHYRDTAFCKITNI